MSLKEEELQKAKEVAVKFESELKEVVLKHTSVKDGINGTNTFPNFILPSLAVRPKPMWKYISHIRH